MALEVADIRTPDDLNGAFDTMVAKQVGALLIVIGKRWSGNYGSR